MSYESLHTQGHVASTEVFPSRVLLVESWPGHRRCQPRARSQRRRALRPRCTIDTKAGTRMSGEVGSNGGPEVLLGHQSRRMSDIMLTR